MYICIRIHDYIVGICYFKAPMKPLKSRVVEELKNGMPLYAYQGCQVRIANLWLILFLRGRNDKNHRGLGNFGYIVPSPFIINQAMKLPFTRLSQWI